MGLKDFILGNYSQIYRIWGSLLNLNGVPTIADLFLWRNEISWRKWTRIVGVFGGQIVIHKSAKQVQKNLKVKESIRRKYSSQFTWVSSNGPASLLEWNELINEPSAKEAIFLIKATRCVEIKAMLKYFSIFILAWTIGSFGRDLSKSVKVWTFGSLNPVGAEKHKWELINSASIDLAAME